MPEVKSDPLVSMAILSPEASKWQRSNHTMPLQKHLLGGCTTDMLPLNCYLWGHIISPHDTLFVKSTTNVGIVWLTKQIPVNSGKPFSCFQKSKLQRFCFILLLFCPELSVAANRCRHWVAVVIMSWTLSRSVNNMPRSKELWNVMPPGDCFSVKKFLLHGTILKRTESRPTSSINR